MIIRFRHLMNGNGTPSARLAVLGLSKNTERLVDLVEGFFGRMSIRAIQYANENALRTSLDALLFHDASHACISELKLNDAGRPRFADIFIPSQDSDSPAYCLELKHASLIALWRGMHNDLDGDWSKLEEFRRQLNDMSLEKLLGLKVVYREAGSMRLVETSINDMKNSGITQLTHYLELIQTGDKGVDDYRIDCLPGGSELVGYVLVCIGTTRVIGWEVKKQRTKHWFKAKVPRDG